MVGPTCQEGEQNLGPQRERTLQRRNGFPRGTGCGVLSSRAHSRMSEGQWMLTKVTGQGSRHLLRRMGGGTKGMVDVPKQGRSRDREALGTSREARSGVNARLADRVVVALRSRDNITPAEQRTRGAVVRLTTRRRTRHGRAGLGPTGEHRRVAEAGATDAPNSHARQGASERTVRSHRLEAVLGKTRRTEFQRGARKRSYGPMLTGHEAGNGGHSQAGAYEPPRLPSTQQTRTHGLKGGSTLHRVIHGVT